MSELRELYQSVILDHNKKPRNFREPSGANRSSEGHNPLCGDVIDLMLRLEGDRIAEVHFEGKGCSISQASASMMSGALTGSTIQEALQVMATFTRMLHGDMDAAADTDLGDLRALAGVAKFPVRVKCALLAWNCLDEMVGPGATPS